MESAWRNHRERKGGNAEEKVSPKKGRLRGQFQRGKRPLVFKCACFEKHRQGHEQEKVNLQSVVKLGADKLKVQPVVIVGQ